ncbi:hypothetical protein DPMN_090382 [Dreissena polymorpha]|uniref:Uncharacterized protein n=1 Tax=Dreissena polymorpha TaxID=45954 RepID=A0A9D4KYM6_DREPO|nr:hypothetical protein DPMN_090382 [Dreissena polymorpha]
MIFNKLINVLTKKTAPPHGGHVFQRTGSIFKLSLDIISTHVQTKFHEDFTPITNVMTKFHEDWTISLTSRVLTRKTTPPPGGHVFQRTGTIFKLSLAIIRTNVLTKVHEDWTINKTLRVLTSENCPAPWRPSIIGKNVLKNFQHDQGIIWKNVLTKFHQHQTIHVASRMLTRRRTTHDGQKVITKAHH